MLDHTTFLAEQERAAVLVRALKVEEAGVENDQSTLPTVALFPLWRPWFPLLD